MFFYCFISENFISYIEGGDDSVNYLELFDSVIILEIKEDVIKIKGYFIYFSQFFVNVAKNVNNNFDFNMDLKVIFLVIESLVSGYLFEQDIKGLFVDFDMMSSCLGNIVENKNS